ncbi:MAG: ATP-binding protein [Alistipes sp.]|nr:ATP-binding protein [Alistipes sp.]
MGRVSNRRFASNRDVNNDVEWIPAEIDNEETLTLLTAVCQIVEVARDSQYNPRIYEVAARPISYIVDLLFLTERQAVVYALVMDMYYDPQISTYDIGRSLGISPLKAMIFRPDLEELCRRNYLVEIFDEDVTDKNYSVTKEAITSLQQDCAIVYRGAGVDSAEEWFGALDKIVTARCNRRIDYDTYCMRVEALVRQNEELQMIKRFKMKESQLTTEEKMLFWWVCNMVICAGYEAMVPDNFRKLYSDMAVHRTQRKSLALGSNGLIKSGMLRIARSSEQRTKDSYELTPWVVKEMLAELELDSVNSSSQDVVEHTSITPKQLFYNEREQRAIDQLSALLQPSRFVEVRSELESQGFRKGFACLFHGAPGTGKTETVLQLARATGRNLMQVNISEVKSMWVGESEKNIKAIFTRYRRLVEASDVAPILLFNEADAIIGKRLENVQRSVDKMENSIQNIILEEMEKLDGILIATTNLTCNMDTAFERRFLYKIEFEKPSVEAKSAIWQSMISGLSADDATQLAVKYDFSGGQIENIARKSVVDKILTGEDLSLDTLCTHCDSELMDDNKNRRQIGF